MHFLASSFSRNFESRCNSLTREFEILRTFHLSFPSGTTRKITLIQDNIADFKKQSKLKELQDYLQNTREYVDNYNQRKKANETFTSQIAEVHTNTIINARHKRKQKMQWTRLGAHNVLQVRAIMASNKWEKKWLDLVSPTLEKVA